MKAWSLENYRTVTVKRALCEVVHYMVGGGGGGGGGGDVTVNFFLSCNMFLLNLHPLLTVLLRLH